MSSPSELSNRLDSVRSMLQASPNVMNVMEQVSDLKTRDVTKLAEHTQTLLEEFPFNMSDPCPSWVQWLKSSDFEQFWRN